MTMLGQPPNVDDVVPRADVALPRKLTRRKSSERRNTHSFSIKELPLLKDADPESIENLFMQKLELCSIQFNFDDPACDRREKELKRQTILELIDYVNTASGQKIFTDNMIPHVMHFVRANIIRSLPIQIDGYDPDEDEPVLELAWPHLQIVYEFFLRFIVSSEVKPKVTKKYIDQNFIIQLLELFDSEDPRERDYLKTILHRIYGKFMQHRSFIRMAISHLLYRFIYETERFNGVAELLEILGSIINGFAVPLKQEHSVFLERTLIPLHKPKGIAAYHQHLSYCIIQYIEKDPNTSAPIVQGLIKFWPWSCSAKQILLINELEEVLELLGAEQIVSLKQIIFQFLVDCIGSPHFQVIERILLFWNNEQLISTGCLSLQYASELFPLIFGPLYRHSNDHWSAAVQATSQNILKMYLNSDRNLYDRCCTEYFLKENENKTFVQQTSDKWEKLKYIVHQKSTQNY